MEKHNWTRFNLRIPINASIEDIYNSWTSQEQLEKWFLRKAEFSGADGSPRPSSSTISTEDTYVWMWHGWSDEVAERGKIIELNGKDFLKFSFGKAGIVSVVIKTEAGENIVELQQEEIPTDEKSQVNFYVGCSVGWTFYLANLKSILEGGLDLRNKNVKIAQVISS